MAWVNEQSEVPLSSNQMKFDDNFVLDSVNESYEQHLPDSHIYIARLESKLARLKDQTRVSAKQILDGLQQAREFYMNQLLERAGTTSSSSVDFVDSGDSKRGLMNNVERHLFPEKMALNPEELQKLLEADLLVKNTEENIPDVDASR